MALQLHDQLQLLERRKLVHNVHLNVGASDVTCDIAEVRDCKQATNKQKEKRGVTNDHDQCHNVLGMIHYGIGHDQ